MTKICAAVDLGGTTVKIGFLTEEGIVLEKWEIPTNKENGGKSILSDIATSIKEHLGNKKLSDLCGVGIGVPGPVQNDSFVERCVNLGWGATDVGKELSVLLDNLPVKVGNDANIAALGEQWMGGGKGADPVMFYTLGTGVGGGLIYKDRIVTGFKGMAAEVGHLCMEPNEVDACNCGGHGCLEQYASATGIVKEMKRTLQSGVSSRLSLESEFSCKDVLDAAKDGDKAAVETIERSMDYLARSMAYVSYVIDPQVFVIGGGVSKAGTYLVDLVEKYFNKYCQLMKEKPKFGLATLGNDAGMYGAARLIFLL
ncbi:Glucokinase [Lachnospiraceae bacterium TWA4]|nr:Glucokinase [Lachnospiraceae bacterium TWA4]